MDGIEELERIQVRAVPPVESFRVGRWVGALGRGVLSRTNSLTTFGEKPWDLFEAVTTVESRYRSRGRPVRFRLTALDAELDDLLFARGYERTDQVAVMTRTIGHQPTPAEPVEISGGVTDRWLEMLAEFAPMETDRIAELGESLRSLDLPHALFNLEGRAVGVGVVEDGWVGLFDLAVHPDHRREGRGREITQAIISWGADRGATSAYLQVHTHNQAAQGLYLDLGFEEAYRYWYRVRE